MKRRYLEVLLVVVIAIASTGSLVAQQADRGIITGLVTDTSGAAVPGAVVTVINERTSVKTEVATSLSGDYSTPPLILGTYTVQVRKEGFDLFLRRGITLESGAVYRQDAALRVGKVSQTVEVTAAPEMINPSTPEVSAVINERYYHDLPVIASQDMRLPEALLYVQPGFVPVAQTNFASFPSGTQFMSRMNGGQAMGIESYLDGASFGQGGNTNLTFESSPPYESVSEMRVDQSTFSAQIGRTSGGLISYTTKSGTSLLHGSAYEYNNNDSFNAIGETNGTPPSTKVNSYGFTLGGPVVIPKVYDGRKKTFFFFNADFTNKRRGVLPNYNLTSPIQSLRTGDFSSILNTADQVGTDALGRPVYAGEIFDPSTSRLVNGVPTRDGFGFDPATGLPSSGAANIILAGHPLLSSIAAKYTALIPQPERPGIQFNYAQRANDKSIDAKTIIARVDHSAFNDRLKLTTTVNWNTRPRITNCFALQGCDYTTKDTYIGNGYFQRIRAPLVHQQLDWIMRPNLFNHTTLAWEAMDHPNIALAANVGWQKKLGVKGLQEDTGGPPQVSFIGTIPFTQLGESQYTADDRPNRTQVLDDLTWTTGRHTVKVGIDYRHMIFARIDKWNVSGVWNFADRLTGGYDSLGNLLGTTGNSFASFLLGQVDSVNFTINNPVQFRGDYISPWVNDEIKVNPRLTLNLGLRWDYQTAMTEQYGRLSTFDPNTPNPGAGGIPGAMVFAGSGPGRTGLASFQKPVRDGWGPRVGFAYRMPGHVVNVIRGGYGIYYASVNMNQFASSPDIGFNTNPTAPNLTNGFAPAFYWDDGFPASNVIVPPLIDPTVANGTSPIALTADSFNLPRYQNWSLTVEREVAPNLLLDISYVGSKGTRLVNAGTSLGTLDNMNSPSVLGYGAAVLNSDINSQLAQEAGIQSPYPGFVGNVAQALRPWPQYQGINYWRTHWKQYLQRTGNQVAKAFLEGIAGRGQLHEVQTHYQCRVGHGQPEYRLAPRRLRGHSRPRRF